VVLVVDYRCNEGEKEVHEQQKAISFQCQASAEGTGEL
jgi:hypothetical protein